MCRGVRSSCLESKRGTLAALPLICFSLFYSSSSVEPSGVAEPTVATLGWNITLYSAECWNFLPRRSKASPAFGSETPGTRSCLCSQLGFPVPSALGSVGTERKTQNRHSSADRTILRPLGLNVLLEVLEMVKVALLSHSQIHHFPPSFTL